MGRGNSNIITYSVDRETSNGLYISVQNGEVLVKAPNYLSREQIGQVIEEKKNWIINKLKEYEQPKELKKEINKTIGIFGKDYFINVNYKFVNMPTLNIENKNIQIILPKAYKKIDNEKVLKILLEKMYSKIAINEIESLMEKYRVMLGIAPEDYEIKKIKNAMANCSKDKKITINPEIITYDKKIINYIILHQFCHLKYKTHSKGFYEMLEKYMPEYKKYEEKLNETKY